MVTHTGRRAGPYLPYDLLPECLREGTRRYITQGITPGGFLQAVISDELREAVCRADPDCLWHLREIVQWFYNEAPAPCYGSRETMQKWTAEFVKEKLEVKP